jgi:Flp pilus assembly pilin Flp
MTVCGLVIGWRIDGGPVDAAVAYALLAVFAFAMISRVTTLAESLRTLFDNPHNTASAGLDAPAYGAPALRMWEEQ